VQDSSDFISQSGQYTDTLIVRVVASEPRRLLMAVIVLLMLLVGPRLVIFLTWLFSNYFNRAYESNFWPFLGFLFMPYTMLCYAMAVNNFGGTSGMGMVVLIIGILLDFGVIGRGASRRNPPPAARVDGPGNVDIDGLKRVN
jgi:hypothetical protein